MSAASNDEAKPEHAALMADDERRAEIEGKLTRYLAVRLRTPEHASAYLARDVLDFLDRLRDARGDDEAAREPMDCERCGGMGHLDAMGGPAHHVTESTPCPDCARSPQGEGHEESHLGSAMAGTWPIPRPYVEVMPASGTEPDTAKLVEALRDPRLDGPLDRAASAYLRERESAGTAGGAARRIVTAFLAGFSVDAEKPAPDV